MDIGGNIWVGTWQWGFQVNYGDIDSGRADAMCHLEAKVKKLAGSEGEAYRDINRMARISDQLLSSGKQQ